MYSIQLHIDEPECDMHIICKKNILYFSKLSFVHELVLRNTIRVISTASEVLNNKV